MKSSSVTNDQALALLGNLASNEGFRVRMQEDPRSTLIEFGISSSVVAQLPEDGIARFHLADRAAFGKAHRRLRDDMNEHPTMVFPLQRLDYGDRARSESHV